MPRICMQTNKIAGFRSNERANVMYEYSILGTGTWSVAWAG